MFARVLPVYSPAWVQPVVLPAVLSREVSSSWVRAAGVFECQILFHRYIKIMLADANEHQLHVVNRKLPKKLW